jgi:hypothetical protein
MESRFPHALTSTDRSGRRFTMQDSLCSLAYRSFSRITSARKNPIGRSTRKTSRSLRWSSRGASIPFYGVEHHISPYTMLPGVLQFLNYMAGRTAPVTLSTD